jgi:hypothetical protein
MCHPLWAQTLQWDDEWFCTLGRWNLYLLQMRLRIHKTHELLNAALPNEVEGSYI